MKKGLRCAGIFAMVAGLIVLGFISAAFSETKPIELKLASWDPPQALPAQLVKKFADRINQNANGKLKVTPYYAETLMKQQEHFRGTSLGVSDMAYFGPNSPGSPIVLGKVITLPFLGITTIDMATDIYSKLLEESPELKAEYNGLKVRGLFCLPFDNLHMVKKPVHVPADAKGIKIIALGTRADLMKEIGAVPVTMGLGDFYTSLERGLVDGLYFLTNVLRAFKGVDLFKYHTIVNGSLGVNMIIINEQKYNSLSPDLQAVIDEAGRYLTQETHAANRVEEESVMAEFKQKGHEVYFPTDAEMKLWYAAAKPVHDKWLKETEAKNPAARKVYDQLQQAIQSYKK